MNMHKYPFFIIAILAVVCGSSAHAASGTWTGATSVWQLDTNWTGLTYPGTSAADKATFTTGGNTTPTIGSGTLTIAGLIYGNGSTNYTITGAGVSSTTLNVDINALGPQRFIDWTNGSATSTTQSFSALTLNLTDSTPGGQNKILAVGGRAILIASDAALSLGSSQTVYLERSSGTGVATLTINGGLSGGTSSTLVADNDSVINLNTNTYSSISIQAGNGGNQGTVNLMANGSYSGASISLATTGGVINVGQSGLTLTNVAMSYSGSGSSNGTIGTNYTGTSSISSGTITFSTGGSVGKVNNLHAGTGATLVIDGTTTLNGGNGTQTVVNKTGDGVLNLAKATGNSFVASAFNVQAGTLLVTNTSNSATGSTAVNVSSGATVAGTGFINGVTTVSGIVAPGNSSIGTLTVNNDLTWNGGASASSATDWVYALGASNTADLLNLTSAGSDFTKGTGSAFRFDFSGSTAIGTFKLVDWTGTTNFVNGDFSYTNLGNGLAGSFNVNGSQLDFVTSAVPEPSTWALLGAAGVMAFALRRRKR